MPPRKRKQQAAEPMASASDVDPAKMKVAELKEELEKRGLDSTGKKADLVSRLEDALNSTPSPTKKAKEGEKSKSEGAMANYSKMKVAELKQELEIRGLDATGKKADLVSRLEDDDKGATSTTTQSTKADAKAAAKKEPKKPALVEEGGADESDFSKAMRALKSAQPSKKKTFKRKVDSQVYGRYDVFEDWDCMLNQTNIGHNNNKFYVIQLLSTVFGNTLYYVWTRWGRVGEPGQNALKGPFSLDAAKKEFAKKYSDKTKNKWENRDNFTPVPGKYTLLEMDDDSGDEEEVISKLAAIDEPDAPPAKVKSCSLDKPTQALIKLIFDNDMFRDAMKSMEIDTKKMPLGKLSKLQIAKGFEALEQIETGLNAKVPRSKLAELTSKFYTIIPHSFGRTTPPVIADHETLQKKFDMLLVLGDIEIAQGLQKDKDDKQKAAGGEVPHPFDMNYELLKAKLDHISKDKEDFKVLERYLKATEPQWRKLEILDIWTVDRQGENDKFKVHDAVDNRRLLWHGTNVAVVAAILKSGLRIMPHSGGRVGKGIYFASECSKSAGYVRCSGDRTGIMFLNEVALGKEHHILRDDWTLTKPPDGFESIVAKGHTEPESSKDTKIVLEGKTVVVPQGKPVKDPKFSGSSFSQSEYLVYKESQARIRYLLKLRF